MSHFAVDAVRNRIVTLLPPAFVLAEVHLAGQTWIVVRPLQDAHAQASWVTPGEDWRAALSKPDGHILFAEFLRKIEQATLADVPDIS